MPANRKVQPRLAPETIAYLRDLAQICAYGTNQSDVARALIEAGIRDALAKGIIAVRRREPIGS